MRQMPSWRIHDIIYIFHRLVRFMIIGLLDVRWETRHGCSLGLMGLLHGLGLGGFPDPQNIGTFSNSSDSLGTSESSRIMELNSSENVSYFDGVGVEIRQEEECTHGEAPTSQDAILISEQGKHVLITPSREASTLPQYLVEDIVCTGLCLLVLDRFIDWRGSSSVTMSPAKEVIIVLCVCLSVCLHFESVCV